MLRIISLSLAFSSLIALTACAKSSDVPSGCIDQSKVCTTCACTKEYDPVCGCDNNTYSNSCEAQINGVTSWTKGKCGF